MIKIYGMETCPDCTHVKEQVNGDGRYEIIDIGSHVRNLKVSSINSIYPLVSDSRTL